MIDTAYQLEIIGPPRSQKNNKTIAQYPDKKSKTGWSYALVDSSRVKSWRKTAVAQLEGQWVGRPPIAGKLAAVVTSYLGKGQSGDTDNLLAGPLDALQAAGVVENDRLFDTVVSIRRRDRDNPRSEILIMPDEWLDIRITRPGGRDG
jgi:Holliday junction resolvase RusA-like endonuclease